MEHKDSKQFNGPVNREVTRLKLALLCLGGMVLVLALALIGLVTQYSDEEQPAIALGESPVAIASNINLADTTHMLIARNKIVAGTKIAADMLTSRRVSRIDAPSDAFIERDLQFLVGKYAKRDINSEFPISEADISTEQVVNTLDIPSGFRAVTVNVDQRTAVEGFAKPNTRVDVLWFFKDRGEDKLTTIVRFAKVLSVNGMTDSESAQLNSSVANKPMALTTATLLVKEEEGRMLELAQNLGQLSLSLVGKDDLKLAAAKDSKNQTVTVRDIFRYSQGTDYEEDKDGSLRMVDSKSGQMVTFNLVNGSWKKADEQKESKAGEKENMPRTVSSFVPQKAEIRWNPIGLTVPKDE